MRESMVVNISYHANDPNVGLPLHQDFDRFKMFLADTGLFVTLAFWDKAMIDNVIYQKLLSDKLSADLGYVYENVIAQMLKAAGHELYYYTFPTDSGKHNYEIDFLISEGDKISPIEVKSSGYKTHASLDNFCEKYSSRIKNRYLIYTKDLRRESNVTYLPAYMTMFL
jgi:predicted AAA+ superfamily ATPase